MLPSARGDRVPFSLASTLLWTGGMIPEARCGRASTVTNGVGLEMDGIEGAPRERIEAVLLRNIGGCATPDKLEREFERPL